MTHNAYAVLNPSESTYQATYKVYLGDQNTGVETSGYTGAEVQFDFIADPILTADFNEDSFVNSDDLAIWQQHFGTSNGATNDQGDTSSDGDVDGHEAPWAAGGHPGGLDDGIRPHADVSERSERA